MKGGVLLPSISLLSALILTIAALFTGNWLQVPSSGLLGGNFGGFLGDSSMILGLRGYVIHLNGDVVTGTYKEAESESTSAQDAVYYGWFVLIILILESLIVVFGLAHLFVSINKNVKEYSTALYCSSVSAALLLLPLIGWWRAGVLIEDKVKSTSNIFSGAGGGFAGLFAPTGGAHGAGANTSTDTYHFGTSFYLDFLALICCLTAAYFLRPQHKQNIQSLASQEHSHEGTGLGGMNYLSTDFQGETGAFKSEAWQADVDEL